MPILRSRPWPRDSKQRASGKPGAVQSAPSAAFTFTLDTSAPAAPTISLTADTGSSNTDKITTNGSLTLGGLELNATPQYSIDGGATWSTAFNAVPGVNSVQARQIDLAGNASTASGVFTFTLDVPPLAPTLSLKTDTGSSNSDKVTNDGTLTPGGVQASAKVEYSADGGATWSTTFTPVQGVNTVIARQTSVLGTISASSQPLTFTYDSLTPTTPTLALVSDTGASNSDGVTSNGATTLTGVEAGTLLQYSIDNGANWTGSFSPVQGANSVEVRQTDLAGNVSAISTLAFTLDTIAPTAAISRNSTAVQATGTPLQFTVTFSEPVVGIDANSFILTGSNGGAIVTGYTVSGSTYTVNVNPGSKSGTVELDLNTANIKDLAGNSLSASGFKPAVTLNTYNNIASTALGDVNGDGKLDLVTSEYSYKYLWVSNASYNGGGYWTYGYDNQLDVRYGIGDGSFSAPTVFYDTLPSWDGNRSIKLVDINGDGKLDLLATTETTNRLMVFIGNGTGSFAGPSSFAAGSTPLYQALADFNGDGKLDVAITDWGTGTVSVLPGNGNGTFGAPIGAAVNPYPFSIVAADFNGDGKQDIAVGDRNGGNLSIRFGAGNGTFTAANNDIGFYYIDSLATGDLNADGKVDLVVTDESNNIYVLLGNGNGTFQPRVAYQGDYGTGVTIADVNGDGKADIVGTGYYSTAVLLGNGDGTFQQRVAYSAYGGWSGIPQIGDLNGDGKPDIVTGGGWYQSVSILLNSFNRLPGPAYTLTFATVSGPLTDGYISGATVFADSNNDGIWEAGEAKTTTDASGHFQLQNAIGPLVATGGVDISTNLAFTGTFTAPSGYSIISPLTTLVNRMVAPTGSAAEIAAAEQKVLAAFGVTLGAGQSLASTDPVAGTQSGDAVAKALLLAGAKVADTIKMLSSAISTATGASASTTTDAAAQALAAQIANSSGAIDLSATATIGLLALQTAQNATHTQPNFSNDFVANLSNVVANSNAGLDTAANAADPAAAIAASQTVAQGQTSQTLSDPTALSGLPSTPSVSLAADTGFSATDKVTKNGALNVSGLKSGGSWQYSLDSGTSWIAGVGATVTLTGDGAKSVLVRQTDLAGNISAASAALNFTLDTTAAAVNSVSASGAAVNVNGNGALGSFDKVYLTLTLSEAVTLNLSGGSPTLTLNNGGVAAYDASRSTASSLVFGYTVSSGQNTPDLAITAFNLNGATIADLAGNGFISTGALVNPAGVLSTAAGTSGAETLYGNSAGVPDTLRGGAGNDTYIVYTASDGIAENPNEGIDTVATSLASYALPFNVENLTYTGAGNFNGTGNSLSNAILGGAGNDTLFGNGSGAVGDTLTGGLGDDTYYLPTQYDVIIENAGGGTDTVVENLSYYLLAANVENLTKQVTPFNGWAVGNSLDNVVQGSTGFDILLGGAGNDTIISNGGSDDIEGDAGNDVMYGGATGSDTMRGGAGNDSYYVYSAAQQVFENPGEGADSLFTTLSTYALGYNFENLTYIGAGNFNGTGNSLSNVITGGAGNDTLDGAGGGDILVGGGGNDTFYVRDATDVIQAAAGGTNTVYESLSNYLMPTNVQNLFMTSPFNSNATGNGLNDTITGNANANYIDVRAGGLAHLTGGSGADTFAFQAGKTNGDVITDFSGAGGQGDQLELHGYGQSWQGANIAQLDATHWTINSADGTIHDTITLSNGASVGAGDFRFLT